MPVSRAPSVQPTLTKNKRGRPKVEWESTYGEEHHRRLVSGIAGLTVAEEIRALAAWGGSKKAGSPGAVSPLLRNEEASIRRRIMKRLGPSATAQTYTDLVKYYRIKIGINDADA